MAEMVGDDGVIIKFDEILVGRTLGYKMTDAVGNIQPHNLRMQQLSLAGLIEIEDDDSIKPLQAEEFDEYHPHDWKPEDL